MGHVATILGNSLVVHGGRTSPDQALADVWTAQLPHDPSSALTWARLKPSALQPAARHRHTAVLVKSRAEVNIDTVYPYPTNGDSDSTCSDKLCI